MRRSFFLACKLIRVLTKMSYVHAFLLHRVAAGVEHEPLLRRLACRTVIDIGANRGQFALAAYASGSRVIHSFEPLESAAKSFESVFRHNQHVALHKVAIGPERARSILHVSNREDSSSLLPIGAGQISLFPGTGEVRTASVQIAPLQDFVAIPGIRAPALLKIDVQGYELDALRGCEALLEAFAYVYVECSFVELYGGQALAHQVIDWLQKRNLVLKSIHNCYEDNAGQVIQADFLFGRA
jgi:FkbM family methyltransferase